jgi:hypothetical protein
MEFQAFFACVLVIYAVVLSLALGPSLRSKKSVFRLVCDWTCDLDSYFWNFWCFEFLVFCITYLFSVGYGRTSPPLRTIKTLSVSLVYRAHFFV